MDRDTLEYIINHLFLPPKLPQKDDSHLEQQLLNHLSNCARFFCEGLRNENVGWEVQARWVALRHTLAQFERIHETPHISKESLSRIIDSMQLDDVICLHIASQNAGVILRRREADLTMEFFQASPTAAAVTGTTGKLVIQFPSLPRLSLPVRETFIHSLSALLADLDCIGMPDAIAKTRKAGSAHDEIREVPDIRYISELLGGIARALTPVESAEHTASSTVYATKRINDHVLWKAALLPWRRSPKWLVIRATLQTTLKEWKIPEKYGYKIFITFVLAKTLEFARTSGSGVSHDLLFVMSAKVSTRLWKLRSVFDVKLHVPTRLHFPIKFISHQMSTVSFLLNEHWQHVQDREATASSWDAPSAAQITAAQMLTLPRSSAHFEAVKARAFTLEAENTIFQPSVFEQHLRSQCNVRKPLAAHHAVCTPDLCFALLALEQRIVEWTESSTYPELLTLADLIEEHDRLASSFKSRSPEIFSRIFLAVLELWVLLDKSTTAQFPLLLDYSPELSISSFEPLLLPELSQMHRLHSVELHLSSRHAQATYPHLSVFTIHNDTASLPSRCFSVTPRMQNLRDEIRRRASEERNQKIQELKTKTDQYNELIEEKELVEHYHIQVPRTDSRGRITYVENKKNCNRCSIEKQISSLTISIFEWPLPENTILSHLVVFELSVPLPFGVWRDTTYRLARSHSNMDPKKTPNPNPVLSKYRPLQIHYVSYASQQRIILASMAAKSLLNSHYKNHSFPCTQSDVILNHPLRYQFWDNMASEWLPSEFPIIGIRDSCTPIFSSGPYVSLTWTAVSTTHTPNGVIARQSQCPAELSYHEWEAFGNLRAGVRLQWRNILLQVITGAANLADPAVYLLIQQAAWQVEAASDDGELGHYRQAHFDLSQEEFGVEIIDVLYERLESISGNWNQGWTAATLGVIACRLFSLNEFGTVKTAALAFLASLRQILFQWMNQVLILLNGLALETQLSAKADLMNRVLQLAASCRSTYAVGSAVLPGIFHDRAAAFIFIRCGLALHTYTPSEISALPTTLRHSLERDTIISAQALPALADTILLSGAGLDDAVWDVWQGFCRDSAPWRNIGGQWMICRTSASSDRQARSIYVNLLIGSFLVDGQAQGTLPKEITRHPLYQTLFPNRATLDIIPSTMKGMEYQSRENMDGFEVHFKLNRNELLIRTRNGNFVSEFVPSEHLEGDIPMNLLVGMVHVFHERTQCMKIYPAPTGWNPSAPAAWCLSFSPEGLRTLSKMADDRVVETILDPACSLVEGLAQIFRPLEASRTNLMVYSRFGQLHITLPRYNLEFSVGFDRLLESKELPGFYVFPSQSIGTLIGLQSKLVLKSRNGAMSRIFVPEGKVSVSGGDHSNVSISPPVTANHIKVFSYDIDDVMGRVIGDGSLTSWYRLAYLHIVTSSYLRDPLIRRTGIEQAQEMLESAQSFAYMYLEPEHNVLLQQIMDLAPARNYYPEHLTSMETVHWQGSLSPVVQCGRFVPLVDAIIDYARKQALFYAPEHQNITAAYRGESTLWKRAEYRVSRLVSNVRVDECDVAAPPARCLDCAESIAKERAVAETVALVRQWPTSVNITDDLWSHFKGWDSFSSEPVVDDKIDNPRVWLQDPPSKAWFRIFHLSRALVKNRDQDDLMVALGIFAHRGDMDLALIRTLLAIATNAPTNLTPAIRAAAESIPMDTFNLAPGHTLDRRDVVNLVAGNCRSVDAVSASLGVARRSGEKNKAWKKRKQSAFNSQKASQCETLAGQILPHWPAVPDMTSVLPTSFIEQYPIVEIPELRREAKILFLTRLRNRDMFGAVAQLQHALEIIQTQPYIVSIPPLQAPSSIYPRVYSGTRVTITLGSLLRRKQHLAPRRVPFKSDLRPNLNAVATTAGKLSHSSASRQLISRLDGMAIDGPKLRYIADLSRCVDALEERDPDPQVSCDGGYEDDCSGLESSIQNILSPQTLFEQWLQWPSTGPESLVQQLSREAWQALPESWRIALTQYAEGLAVKQQQRRIAVLSRPGFEGDYAREVGMRGGQGWDPIMYPDWLLVQLDADLLIREDQASIAEKMMGRGIEENSLMQLNMGEGKSSVIVPIVSAALADGQQLVRVIVLKPLSAQMFQLLKQRVCGLANRRLFYLPFSRDIELDCDKIQQIVALFKECARVGGILLCQPEHILSFQLMALHAFCQKKGAEEAQLLLEAQEWLGDAARDILDESDEILNVRYQLIYTLGAASPPEGRPWRWSITQSVFSLLEKLAKTVPDGLEIVTFSEAHRFPVTRILTLNGRQALLESIVREIVFKDGLQEWISFRTCTSGEKEIFAHFIRELEIAPEDARSVQTFSDTNHFGQLLLLRGLFAHGILSLALQQKRWRVDYGLDLGRSMLAVPYRAKDSPAARAEFGHPDMIIVLTSLSYYYGGLSDDQLNTAFKFLLDSDNPEAQYEHWVKGINNLPANLANLRGLNLEDFEQKTTSIFPLLRYNKAVIDFYLSESVFPKEAREFPYKLTTNAWDLARTKTRLVTGFSGTNDNKYLLPLSITQLDEDSQRHTNAQVLEYILQRENREVLCTNSDDALGLLRRLVQQHPPVMVLLDVGAQVLELQNEEVAREWLKLDSRPAIEAAVYFDAGSDEIRVISRDGRIQPLASSLYKTQLQRTLVYLDEAHTRGTDFKFPTGSRAVVTLGPQLGKDKLVQGCMRMRRLGTDHSVLFFASKEIWIKIQTLTGAQDLDSSHVLLWTIQETCRQISDNGSLWANQGLNFDARFTALSDERPYPSLVAALQERESRTLEELYGVKPHENQTHQVSQLQIEIYRKCNEFGLVLSHNALSEEQERELAHEKEDERELERIPGAKALDHRDDDLSDFIDTGVIRWPGSRSFISLEDCLANTSWISSLPQGTLFRGQDLRATKDFRDTISLPPISSAGRMDSYLRPVQWVLSTSRSKTLVIVSPFEANKWLPAIRRSQFISLHLYSPRISRNWSFEGLDSFTVPRRRSQAPSRELIHELNLFAGQLFCADKRSVKEVCGILGLHLQALNDREDLQGMVDRSGFVRDRRARAELGIDACAFTSTPLPFFRELFVSRRKGQGFAITHMGQILRGNDPKDPDFEVDAA